MELWRIVFGLIMLVIVAVLIVFGIRSLKSKKKVEARVNRPGFGRDFCLSL